MTPSGTPRDLIVLAADLSMKVAIDEILKRHHSLGIRTISFEVIRHATHDSGVLQSGHELLQAQRRNYHHALAVCDRHGCGKEALPREALEALIEKQLSSYWAGRAAAIVIDPELENWVWADSPHVAEAIEWPGGMSNLYEWLLGEGLLTEGQAKPADPKAALEKALRRTKKQRSSSLFQTIASKFSLQVCTDGAFVKLKATLQQWFSVHAS